MKKIAIYGIIAVSAISAGGLIGFGAKKLFGTVLDDYSGFDPSVYVIDGEALIKKIESKPTAGERVATFPVVDIVNYALEKYKRFDDSFSYTVGVADAGITTQKIRAAQIKNSSKYFEESASAGMVGCANRTFQDVGGETIDLHRTKDVTINNDKPVFPYPSTPTNYTLKSYKDAYGKTLDEMFIYTIHAKTTTKSQISKNEDGTYNAYLELSPTLSTYFYKKQMVSISELEATPSFEYIKLTYTLDSNLMLSKLSIDEYFVAKKMGIDAGTRNMLTTKYFPNQSREIPALNEGFFYGDE